MGQDRPRNAKPRKVNVFLWRGLAADMKPVRRRVLFGMLVLASAALIFTQFGFAGIGFSGQYGAYAVVLLVPVALASILLGTGYGTLVGLVAGAVQLAHAKIMPLDYYELEYISIFSSVIMLTVCALMLGIFFAILLRKDTRKTITKVIWIAVICLFVSGVFTTALTLNVIAGVAAYFVENVDLSSMSEERLSTLISAQMIGSLARMGDIGFQVWFDAAIMAAPCYIALFGLARVSRHPKTHSLPYVFNSWLAVAVTASFFLMSASIFVVISLSELYLAERNADGEIDYILEQIDSAEDNTEKLDAMLLRHGIDASDSSSLSAQDARTLEGMPSAFSVIYGYEPETEATIFVMGADGSERIIATNAALPDKEGDFGLDDFLAKDAVDKVLRTQEEDTYACIVYDREFIKLTDGDISDEDVGSYAASLGQMSYAKSGKGGDYIVTMIVPVSRVYAERPVTMASMTVSVLGLLAVVFAFTSLLLHYVVRRRIDDTNISLGRITEGNLDEHVDIRDTVEFASLSDGINDTVLALKGWIHEAETRMDAELSAAQEIQESALPRIFPPFPDIGDFDIYASMKAAREVGGDFYDFFLIEDTDESRKLGFVIADVSGKGVPAALFMMSAKRLVQGYMESGMEVGEAIENANRQLCDGNEAGMFVTLFAGVLDCKTHRIEYVNAGHNPPLVWQNGSWRFMEEKSGLPMGLFDAFGYEKFAMDCHIGDTLLLYTDGVTEAMSAEGELYGEERLEEVARRHFCSHPRELVEAVRKGVAEHADGAEQSDDITVLALEVGVPPEITATLFVPAMRSELYQVLDFIHTELDRRLCPLSAQNKIDIAVEELFVNVCLYAYPDSDEDNPGQVRISYTYSADPPSVTIAIADSGIPYDPLAKSDAVTPDDIMEVPIGGLGILMAKKSVEDMSYEYADGHNITTIVKKW